MSQRRRSFGHVGFLSEGGPGADVVVNLFSMIRSIEKTKEEEEKARLWSEMVPLATSESAARNNNYGQMPLHMALEKKAPLEVLSRLFASWPNAAAVKTSFGSLPLHYAVRYETPLSFITDLLAAYPQGARETDTYGQVPLHVSLVNKAPLEVLYCLFATWPDAVMVKDSNQYLPLHVAARYETPLVFIAQLLEAFPQGAQAKVISGQVPLHLALEAKAPRDVLSRILVAWPDAVKVRDANGFLPLHTAAKFTAPLAFISELLATYPQSTHEKDKEGRVPLCLAFDSKASNEVLASLLLLDLPLYIDERDGSVVPQAHAGSWTLAMDHPDATVEQVSFLVKTVFDKLPSLAQKELTCAKDENGRDAISICTSDVRALMNTYLLFLGQYQLQSGPPEHKSATAIVSYAFDHSHDPPLRVALKFMRHKGQFEREMSSRANSNLDGSYVLPVMHSYNSDELDQEYSQGLARLGYSDYPYCLVLPAADRSLTDIIGKERIVGGRDVKAVGKIAVQLVRALEHVHSKSRIHGDVKPLNVMRIGADIKLIDLDASALMTELAASKFSSAYLPPEFLAQDGSVKQGQVRAHASFDMWSFGCVLFQLCAGEPLWLANDEDHITEQDDLLLLSEWSGETKAKKLAKIKDNNAHDLVSQLLTKDPLQRPASMTQVLSHPFLTN